MSKDGRTIIARYIAQNKAVADVLSPMAGSKPRYGHGCPVQYTRAGRLKLRPQERDFQARSDGEQKGKSRSFPLYPLAQSAYLQEKSPDIVLGRFACQRLLTTSSPAMQFFPTFPAQNRQKCMLSRRNDVPVIQHRKRVAAAVQYLFEEARQAYARQTPGYAAAEQSLLDFADLLRYYFNIY
jgi:hypothetical protein